MSGSSDGIFVPSSPDTAPTIAHPCTTASDIPCVIIPSSDTDDNETSLTTKSHSSTKPPIPLPILPTTPTTSTTPTSTSNYRFSNVSSSPKKKHSIVVEDDDKENKKDHKRHKKDHSATDDSNSCTICFDSWKTTGLHRPCTLKCGHLFGKSCVEKWLKEKRKCPTCNAKASTKDVRVLFINKISAIDPEEVEKVLRREEDLKRKLNMQAEAFNQLHRKYEKLKAQLSRANYFSSHPIQSSSNSNSGFFGSTSNNNNNNNNSSRNSTPFSSKYGLDKPSPIKTENNTNTSTTTSNNTTPNKYSSSTSNNNLTPNKISPNPTQVKQFRDYLNRTYHTNTNTTTTTTSSNEPEDINDSPRPMRSSSTFTFGSTSFNVNPHTLPRNSVINSLSENNTVVFNNKPVNSNNPPAYSNHDTPVTQSQPTQITRGSSFSSFGFSSHTPNKSLKSNNTPSPNKIVPDYPHFQWTYSIQTNESRVFDFCSDLALLLVSHSKDNNQGILKVSGLDRSSGDYIPNIHSKQIRDMKIHPSQPLALTVSLDKTLKVVHAANKTVVMEYPLEHPGWSCAWGEGTDLYAGQANGTVCMFDTRMPRPEPVVKVCVPQGPRPVHSLAYLYDASESLTPSQKGVVCGSVGGVCFMEGSNLVAHVVPLEGTCSSVTYDENTHSCLASFRYTPIFSKPTHVVFKHEGLGAVTELRTLHSTSPQTRLSRSTMFAHPAPSVPSKPSLITAASDEETRQVILWDVSTGTELQRLPLQQHLTIDIKHFRHQDTHFLATLSESSLHVHNWR